MKPRHLALIATVCMLVATAAFAADESDTQQATVGGSIPELCQFAIANYETCTGLLNLTQDGTGESSYDQGYIESAPNATVMWCDANKSAQVAVKRAGNWTCPGGYDKAETDLSIKITNSTGGGSIQNGFNSYKTLTTDDQVMYAYTSGVSDAAIAVQYKVLLDWTQDIPGAYSITLTYTLSTTTG